MRRIQCRSAPAQKAGPSAASTMARTAGRAPNSWKAALSSAISSSLKALRSAGRASVTVAQAPCTEIYTILFVGSVRCV